MFGFQRCFLAERVGSEALAFGLVACVRVGNGYFDYSWSHMEEANNGGKKKKKKTSRACPVHPQDDYIDEVARVTFANLKDDFVTEMCEDPLARQRIR